MTSCRRLHVTACPHDVHRVPEKIKTFLKLCKVLAYVQPVSLEIRVADQEQTHRFLRDAEVMGCISSRGKPIQGCRSVYLGQMSYRMMAAPEFCARWFADGFTREAVGVPGAHLRPHG